MQRRDFLALTGLTAGGLIVPSFFGKVIAAEQLHSTLDLGLKKRLADAALAAARQAGATYCDVRIGRYLRQFVITREDKVQNVVNTESTGVGIRVLANGAWVEVMPIRVHARNLFNPKEADRLLRAAVHWLFGALTVTNQPTDGDGRAIDRSLGDATRVRNINAADQPGAPCERPRNLTPRRGEVVNPTLLVSLRCRWRLTHNADGMREWWYGKAQRTS